MLSVLHLRLRAAGVSGGAPVLAALQEAGGGRRDGAGRGGTRPRHRRGMVASDPGRER